MEVFAIVVVALCMWLTFFLLALHLFHWTNHGDGLLNRDKNDLTRQFPGRGIQGRAPIVVRTADDLPKETISETMSYYFVCVFSLGLYYVYYRLKLIRIRSELRRTPLPRNWAAIKARRREAESRRAPSTSEYEDKTPVYRPAPPSELAVRVPSRRAQQTLPTTGSITGQEEKTKVARKAEEGPKEEQQRQLRAAPGAIPGEKILDQEDHGDICGEESIDMNNIASVQESAQESSQGVSYDVEVDPKVQAWNVPMHEDQRGYFFHEQRAKRNAAASTQ